MCLSNFNSRCSQGRRLQQAAPRAAAQPAMRTRRGAAALRAPAAQTTMWTNRRPRAAAALGTARTVSADRRTPAMKTTMQPLSVAAELAGAARSAPVHALAVHAAGNSAANRAKVSIPTVGAHAVSNAYTAVVFPDAVVTGLSQRPLTRHWRGPSGTRRIVPLAAMCAALLLGTVGTDIRPATSGAAAPSLAVRAAG